MVKIEQSAILKQNSMNSRNTSKTNTGTFGNIIEKFNSAKNQSSLKDGYSSREINSQEIGIYAKADVKKMSGLPIETERYVVEAGEDTVEGRAFIVRDKEMGTRIVLCEAELVIQKDSESGIEYISTQPFSKYIIATPELKNILQEVADGSNLELKEIPPIKEVEINYDSRSGLYAFAIKEKNTIVGAAPIFMSKEDEQTFSRLADEFMQYDICKDSRTSAEIYAAYEMAGNLKRGSEGFTLVTDRIEYRTYDGENITKSWYITMSDQYLDVALQSLSSMDEFEKLDIWIQMLKEQGKKAFFEVWNCNHLGRWVRGLKYM